MKKYLLGGLALVLTAATLSAPAQAQFREYEDYQYSDTLVQLTTVRVDPGQLDTYLEGLSTTWVASNEVAKELGHIVDYGIYYNVAPSSGDFHLMLVVEFPAANMAPSRERYDEFMAAWGRANIDQSNETVLNLYNEIRQIQGEYLISEIEMID